jgi:hypothetical protein
MTSPTRGGAGSGARPSASVALRPRVSYRTTHELYRAAQRRAREEGRTVSDLAREAVARYVKA